MNSFFIYAIFFIWATFLTFFSYILLNKKMSKDFFPFFELFMTLSFILLWQTSTYFLPYFILFSALGVTIQTDLSYMLISRFVSLYLAPTGIILSYFKYLPITFFESVIATIIGYGALYIINKIFYLCKNKNGIGQGDFDLMALVGAYTGLLGIWFTILIASITGAATGLLYMIYKKRRISFLPFGPFLSVAGILFVLFQQQIVSYLL